GMGSQFSVTTTSPWNGGYQMIPRKLGDIITTPVVGPKPRLSFSTNALVFTESAGNQVCPIVMSSAPSVNTSPTIFIKGGTATMLQDYAGVFSVSTSIGPGTQLTNNLPIEFLDDAIAEGSETLIMVIRKGGLESDTAYEIGEDSLFTFTIIDNDSPLPAGPPFTRTIEEVRGANTGNAADSTGRNVRLYGTVYGVNQRLTTTGGGYQMYLRDATGGIGIFKTSSFANIPVLNEGDSVKVMGTINVFRGLSQITPDSMVVIATGRNLKNPTVALKVNESLESDLVRINGVQLVDPTKWTTGVGATGFTVKVFKGTDTMDVRIDNDCPLYSQPAPTGTFDIVGMGSQFSVTTTSPWNGGYQMIPRKLGDVITTPVVTPKPVLTFSTPSLTFTESNGSQFCQIQMNATPSVITSPNVFIKGGTASAGTDYTFVGSLSAVMGPGTQLLASLPIDFLDDAVTESSETVTLAIRKTGQPSDTAYEIGADSIFTFTIIDNDSPLPAGPPFTRTIGQIRGNNTGNAADSTGRNVRLYGTVYGVNQRLTTTGGGYQMYLRDATGGIGIFKTSSFGNIPVLSEGDSVKVMGTINVFRGLSQITPDSMVVLATGR
ncbi:MAG TPA: Calx-beta domain-containing protein, partial [Catalimonadaceae bacterium]|nr:Calx-beta domain-containing protein [Catalimonadaceae bacterium]